MVFPQKKLLYVERLEKLWRSRFHLPHAIPVIEIA